MRGTCRLFASVVAALMVMTACARAQTSSPGVPLSDSPSAPLPPSMLFHGIQLSKAQQDSVDVITRRYYALFDAVNREDDDVPIRQRQLLSLREKSRAEKRAVLTPAQRELYDRNAAAQKSEDERLSRELIERLARRSDP